MITVIGNLKGGTGKSTVSFNLAVKLAINNKKVQLIDLDPQETLSDVVDIRTEDGHEPKLRVNTTLDCLKDSSNFDETIIDIGTASIESMNQAIEIADRILVPVPPSQADIWSTQRFLHMVKNLKTKKSLQVLGFVNRADTHRGIRETDETEDALRILPRIELIESRLCQRTTYRRSFSEGLAVFEFEPKGKSAAEINKFALIIYPNI
jgi:chromosome partitioning protein